MTTVTDEMVEVAQNLDFELLFTSRLSKADRMRAVLEAALAVMPAPDDAAFEAAVDTLCGALISSWEEAHLGDLPPVGSPIDTTRAERLKADFVAARCTLLAMHAQAKQQGLRDSKERLQGMAGFIDDNADAGNRAVWDFAGEVMSYVEGEIKQIDAMLGGSHE